MNTDILATMRVRCPVCKAAPGKVCKGYDTWERTRLGPLHEKRHEKAPDPIGSACGNLEPCYCQLGAACPHPFQHAVAHGLLGLTCCQREG